MGQTDTEACFQCDSADPPPDVYCASPECESVYHSACFDEDFFHQDDDDPHERYPLKRRHEQAYINEPSRQSRITEVEILRDRKNTFIEIDHRTLKLKFGDRAFDLLRPSLMDIPCISSMPPSNNKLETPGPIPTPGFISFLGQTGTGKSWIIRSLMRDLPTLPSPLPSPGKTSNNVSSTSSNINLYVDGDTAHDDHPILFMDVEGLDGSDVPVTLQESARDMPLVRRAIAQKVFPKLSYIFSNCIVFVSTDSMQANRRIADTVMKFANVGSRGSLHQGFRPALFIVFNKVVDDVSDWSIKASTTAFKMAFRNAIREELEAYYDPIHVIKIPHSTQSSPMKALDQLEALKLLLRQEHLKACAQRHQFSLSFTLDELMRQLGSALSVFSADDENPSFDWTKEARDHSMIPSFDRTKRATGHSAIPVFNQTETIRHSSIPSSWPDAVKAFWGPCLRLHQDISPKESFQHALRDFSAHFVFCIQLYLHRFPIAGRQVGTLSDDMVKSIYEIQRHVEQFTPCQASMPNGTACGGTRQRHNPSRHESPSARWVGTFVTAVVVNLVQAIETSLGEAGGQKLSVFHAPDITFMRKARCLMACLGCLIIPPSVFLACGHTFCETCVGEMTTQPLDVHILTTITCPFCSHEMTFSPRLLPPGAGYRILSLDGGGVRGIVQIQLLAAIENMCFGIPITHFFDFIIGTSIGGQIALSLTSKEWPSSVGELRKEFFEVMHAGIKRRIPFESGVVDTALLVLFDLTSHKNDPMEQSLKEFYGSDRRVLAASNPPGPLVAVTTVSMNDLSTAQVIPNYVRALKGGEGLHRLIGPDLEDCIRVWEAARATAAAFPYFAPYTWREKRLLDGGFRVNCPAEIGYNEATYVWPERPLDILLSLGTGSYHGRPARPPKNLALKVGRQVVEAMTNSTQLWEAFQARVDYDQSRGFRLDPLLTKDFGLTDVKNLKNISDDAEAWLKSQGDDLANIGNQLIGSLFFCTACTTHNASASAWNCSISCRLPRAVEGRVALVDRLIEVASKRDLFVAKVSNCAAFHCNVGKVLSDWRRAGSQGPIVIPFTISGLPKTGEIKLYLSMGDIFRDHSTRCYPLSGMPYFIRRNVE